MERLFLVLAGLNGLLAVALGAFGAHALKNRLASVKVGGTAPRWARTWRIWRWASHRRVAVTATSAARKVQVRALNIAMRE